MGRKSKFSKEQKIEICRRYLDGSESVTSLAEEINVCITTVQRWIRIFQAYGDSAFDEKTANESYTKEFKRKVVEAYLAGEGSLRDIAVKYKIPACGTVLVWVKLYNDHIELKDYIPGGKEIYMAKCRKVTKEERIEIVKYCMEHDLDYSGTCKVFDVTYSNVFNWVRKYKEKGEDGLSDRRGRRKKDEELDELGLLKKQLREKERELERAHLEIRLLKKVEENEARKQGKKKRYQIGTICLYKDYLLTAFSKFDENNKALLTMPEYLEFLINFWDKVNNVYAQQSVSTTIFGSGITRIKGHKNISDEDLLKIMLWTFRISEMRFKYPAKLTIVIHKDKIDQINLLDIKSARNGV